MDSLSFHLILNSVPVVGGIGAILLLGWGLWRRSTDIIAVALGTFVGVALIAIPVFATGRQAARAMFPAASPALLEEHEGIAVAALIGLLAAAVTAVSALVAGRSRRTYPLFPVAATLVLGLVASVLLLRASAVGGQLHQTGSDPPPAIVRSR